MPNHATEVDPSTGDSTPGHHVPRYGADWVGIDTRAMQARREAQREREREAFAAEQARRRVEEEESDLYRATEEAGPAAPSRAPVEDDHGALHATKRSTPNALIERLKIENLRAFSGAHDIPLAPLTLIYGPNSAGKSTLIKALRLFMEVVDAGRFDSLHPWEAASKEASLRNLMTYAPPDPDDPSGSDRRSPLVLGVDFRAHDGRRAYAELGYELNPVGSIDPHTTSFAPLDGGPRVLKRFTPENIADEQVPFHPADFGESGLTRFIVEETRDGEHWSRTTKQVDAELFGQSDTRLQAELFELAYLLRHLGPHRGAPGKAYDPDRGRFNADWFDRFRKPRRQGFNEFDLLNQMLVQLEIPYEFVENALWKLDHPHDPKWSLKDTRSGTPVDLNQVGYGISQLLPVIDLCVHAERQIICIEEPELHLHPRLQARLANMFATAAVEGGNQVIVETHSESILLRVERLVRGGKLLPEDVAIIYVDNTASEGASARRLHLDKQGELLEPWPTGFFDDSLADILGVTG